MTGGKSPGGGQREVCLPGHQAAGDRFQKREVLSWGSSSCGLRQSGHRGGHGKSEGWLPYPRRGKVSLPWSAGLGQGDPG